MDANHSWKVTRLIKSLNLLKEATAGKTSTDCNNLAQSVIDTLCGYHKPCRNGDTQEPLANKLGAYLHTSNARNACKLRQLGYIQPYAVGFKTVRRELEAALRLLVDTPV